MYPTIRESRHGFFVYTYVFNFGRETDERNLYDGIAVDVNPGSGNIASDDTKFLRSRALQIMFNGVRKYYPEVSIWWAPLIDLVSLFNIYKRRRECTIPVIRKKIIEVFDAYVRDYEEKKNPEITSLLFIYLVMNAYVLGFPIPIPRQEFIASTELTDKYVPLVRDEIMKLE